MSMSLENLAIIFAVFSAIANIIIAVIAARGRWWEKADKIDDLIDTLKTEAQSIRSDFSHLSTEFHALRDDFKSFQTDNQKELRKMDVRLADHDRRIATLERMRNT